MSNLSRYSPVNKSYKFIAYQNQAYHLKNKFNASPQVKTNLKHSMSRHSPILSPKNHFQTYKFRTTRSPSAQSLYSEKKQLFQKDKELENVRIDQPKRQIHRDQNYQKKKMKKIGQQNDKMILGMLSSCSQVPRKDQALKAFQKHQNYKRIRMRYRDDGYRKSGLSLGNKSMLCPTLSEYLNGGLGKTFLDNIFLTQRASRIVNNKIQSIKIS